MLKYKMESSKIKQDNENQGPFYFNNLIRQNERALIHLSNIRLKFIEYSQKPWNVKVGQITREYDACIGSIKEMADNFGDLLKTMPCFYPGRQIINSKIKKAEERGIDPVLKLEGIIAGIRPKIEEEIILNKLYETVEKLNVFGEEPAELGNVSTLHDMIRYMHQEAVNILFQADKIPGFQVYKTTIRGEHGNKLGFLKVINTVFKDLNSTEKLCEIKKIKNLSLRAIFEGYHELKNKTTRWDIQALHILAGEDSILAQIMLGSHEAKLESKINDEDPFISLFYRDTDFQCSDNRLFYMGLVLGRLGYEVEITGKNINASLYNKSKKQTYGVLKETIKLFKSAKDLDMTSDMRGREHEAAFRFLTGDIDLARILIEFPKMDPKTCERFVSGHNYDWGRVKI